MARDIVLVHGMSHGAWCWELLEPRLRRAGHRVLAVDLPGHGRRAHERARASVTGYAQAVADAMMLEGVHDAIVVGHSMAGVVIPKVAELVPARVAHLVFLAAIVLPNGGSTLAMQFPLPLRELFIGHARSGGGGRSVLGHAGMVAVDERLAGRRRPGGPGSGSAHAPAAAPVDRARRPRPLLRHADARRAR